MSNADVEIRIGPRETLTVSTIERKGRQLVGLQTHDENGRVNRLPLFDARYVVDLRRALERMEAGLDLPPEQCPPKLGRIGRGRIL